MSQTPPLNAEWSAFCAEIKAATARKPTTPRKPKPVTANGLTRQIISHIRANGFFATRLNSTGLYRSDLGKYVKSQQVVGLPDIMGIAPEGRVFFAEIKVGRDSLSIAQKEAISALQIVGTPVWVVGDFATFLEHFNARFAPTPTDI